MRNPAHPEILAQLHPALVTEIDRRGIPDLYPPQWEAIAAGITGRDLVISIPTASGKTLIAEVLVFQKLLAIPKEERKKCKVLYLAPLRALAAEKFKEFKKAWEPHGFTIGISMSDLDRNDYGVFANDVILLTNEKANSLLQQNPKFMQNIGIVVCDEIHLMNDETRGVTLEFLLTRLRVVNRAIQFIGLSATISNARELADWLGAQLIWSDWRPVILKEGYYATDTIEFGDGSTRKIPTAPQWDPIVALTLDMLREGGQVLVFANSRRNAMSAAEKLQTPVLVNAADTDKAMWGEIAAEFEKHSDLEIEANKLLAKLIRGGVAFHHAGLGNFELDFIVERFNRKQIKVICATPTLAAGVNTPARRVIIQSLYRFSGSAGSQLIPVMEYKQMAGRAGRPGYDPYGEVVIYGSDPNKVKKDAELFISGEPEQIRSKLGEENQLNFHILSLIVGNYANTENAVAEVLQNTFFFHQLCTRAMGSANFTVLESSGKKSKRKASVKEETPVTKASGRSKRGRGTDPLGIGDRSDQFVSAADMLPTKPVASSPDTTPTAISPEARMTADRELRRIIHQILGSLRKHDFIKTDDPKSQPIQPDMVLKGTPFGNTTIKMYLMPRDALILEEAMAYAEALLANHELNLAPISWLHTVAKTSNCPLFYLKKSDYSYLVEFVEDNGDSFIEEIVPDPRDVGFTDFGQQVKSAMIMQQWMEEVPEKLIVEHFDIGQGDLRRLVDHTNWIMRAMVEIAKVKKRDGFLTDLDRIKQRMLKGVRAELLPLVGLKGIGRVKARNLFREGFKTLAEIQAATEEKLATVPTIGKELARRMKEQLAGKTGAAPKRITKKTTRKTLAEDTPELDEIYPEIENLELESPHPTDETEVKPTPELAPVKITDSSQKPGSGGLDRFLLPPVQKKKEKIKKQ
jgi:helicase